jgi:hypothetical protein
MGLPLEDCEAAAECQAIWGTLYVEEGECLSDASEYLGCSSEQGCDDVISYTCETPDGPIYQTPDSCRPDGWGACDFEPIDPPPCE